MGDRYVDDLKPELAEYEHQLLLLNRKIRQLDRRIGRAERKTDQAYAKSAKTRHDKKWLKRYDRRLIKSHQLRHEYDSLVVRRSSIRSQVALLREALAGLLVAGVVG